MGLLNIAHDRVRPSSLQLFFLDLLRPAADGVIVVTNACQLFCTNICFIRRRYGIPMISEGVLYNCTQLFLIRRSYGIPWLRMLFCTKSDEVKGYPCVYTNLSDPTSLKDVHDFSSFLFEQIFQIRLSLRISMATYTMEADEVSGNP